MATDPIRAHLTAPSRCGEPAVRSGPGGAGGECSPLAGAARACLGCAERPARPRSADSSGRAAVVVYRKGADPDALDRAAGQLDTLRRRVPGHALRGRPGGRRARRGAWGGGDFEAFRGHWRSSAPSIDALERALHGFGARLRENAAKQRGCQRRARGPVVGWRWHRGWRTCRRAPFPRRSGPRRRPPPVPPRHPPRPRRLRSRDDRHRRARRRLRLRGARAARHRVGRRLRLRLQGLQLARPPRQARVAGQARGRPDASMPTSTTRRRCTPTTGTTTASRSASTTRRAVREDASIAANVNSEIARTAAAVERWSATATRTSA